MRCPGAVGAAGWCLSGFCRVEDQESLHMGRGEQMAPNGPLILVRVVLGAQLPTEGLCLNPQSP